VSWILLSIRLFGQPDDVFDFLEVSSLALIIRYAIHGGGEPDSPPNYRTGNIGSNGLSVYIAITTTELLHTVTDRGPTAKTRRLLECV
jgi:hypothetical protein